MANLVVSAVSTFNNKGLKQGKKEISAFEKNVKSLGKTFGVVFAASTLVNFSKKAVDAFAKDQAAAKALETQLKNTGYAFSAPDVEFYIGSLEKMYGVLDDQLRPAFQTLLTASGSLTKSQKALAIALDISAATGKSVEEVSAAIAKGYTGQTTALARLGAGIDKTTLATGDMNLILDEASKKFSGQALARLTTYAGEMDQLKIASSRVSENIGKGILDALSAIGKDKNISNVANGMENLSVQIANVITGLGVMIGKLTSIGQNSGLFNLIGKLAAFNFKYSGLGILANAGAKNNAPKSNFTYSLGANAGSDIARAKEAKLIKDANKLRASENAALTKKTAVDQLKDKFDLERIGLTAALNAATDEETKLRLRAQLAILDNNEALAKKILAEMNAKTAVDKLTDAANSAAKALMGIYNALGVGGDQGGAQRAADAATSNYTSSTLASNAAGAAMPTFGRSIGDQNPNLLTINVDATSMIDPNQITQVVQDAVLRINKAGMQLTQAGGL